MARYAADLPQRLNNRRTPHAVIIRDNRLTQLELLRWVRDRDRPGYYRYDEGAVSRVYWFSDADVAFEFKLRYGGENG